MDNKSRHVIVLSVDAMVYEDIQLLKSLYEFERVWPLTARVDHVQSVYPTITYPCHSTMMTGVYPDRHGVINNEQPIMCEKSSLWQHMRESVHAKTIFDYAKESGLTTAAVFWPVTGNDKNIDYLIDEYWPQHGESSEQCFRDAGTSEEVMQKVVIPNLKYVENRHRQHPWADTFVFECACDIIRNFKPNLLMIHPANVDGYRHETGLFTPKVDMGLYETNLWFGMLVKAAQDAGIYDDTDFFVVSDHGQMQITRNVAINVLLAERGLIRVDGQGNITDWTAFSKSGGLSACVYLKHPDSKEDWEKTKKVLDELCAEETNGISRVFTEEEARREEHLGGDFAFVLETDNYTSFGNDWVRPLVRRQDNRNYRFGRATHGYLPEKGPQPTFFAFGPHIKPGVVIDKAYLVDEAPTFARALGLSMEDTDGRCLEEIFR